MAEPERQATRPALESEVPALRWVPADAELVVVANSAAPLLAIASAMTRKGVLPGLSERSSKRSDWDNWGIDLDAPISLYGKDGEFTLLIPSLEAALITQNLERLFGNYRRQEYRGYQLARVQTGGLELSWTRVQGHVVVHIAVSDSLAWVDAMQQSYQGQGYSASAEAIRAKREALGAVWGSARFFPLLEQLVGQELGCVELLGGVDALTFSADMSEQGATFKFSLALNEARTASLRQLQSVLPSPGMRALRETSGLYASVALDLEKTAIALRSAECPELAQLLQTPFQRAGWSPMPAALHGAGSRFDPGSLSGNLGVEFSLHNARFFRRQLDQIPMRSLFESTFKLEGKRVKRLSIPTMSSLYYQLRPQAFVFATQRKLLASLLAAPAGLPGDAVEFASAGIRPQQLPQLGALLRSLLPDATQRDIARALLARLSLARFNLALEQNELSFDGELYARDGQSLLW